MEGDRLKGYGGEKNAAQHSGRSLRVFRLFAWLEVGSIKMASTRPAHTQVTQTVGRLRAIHKSSKIKQ